MAKKNAKRNVKSNEMRMKVFTVVSIAINILYCLMSFVYFQGGRVSLKGLVALAFWGGQEYFCIKLLKNAVRPVYGADGSLESCIDAADPEELGIYSLAQDTLWICWVAQLFCSFHGAFFVFWLSVPTFIGYKLYAFAKPFLPELLAKAAASVGEGGTAGSPKTRDERRREAIKRRKGRLAS